MTNTKSDIQLTKHFSLISIWIMLSISFVGLIGMSYGDSFLIIVFLIPGACHGIMQMQMLSHYTSRNPTHWLLITVGSSSLGWAIIYFIIKYMLSNHALEEFFLISDNIPFSILKGIFSGISFGFIIGTVIGITQWFFARRYLSLVSWLFATVTAWSIGLAIPLSLLFWFIAGMSGLSHIEL